MMDLAEQKKILRERGICVIIPTYNNAGTIVDVVARAMAQCPDVIVVCDGCTDGTPALLSAMTPAPDVISWDVNRGKGQALKAGFRHALDAGFSYAITLDGDGQHYPEDIALFLEANRKHAGALIVGERKNLGDVKRSAASSFANSFSNFWFALQTGRRLKDTQTGYRLYPLKKLYGLSLLTSRYESELELLVFASWHGVSIKSVEVNVYYPAPEDRVSHFRPVRDFARISVLNTVLCVLALVYALPLAVLRLSWTILKTLFFVVVYVFITMFLVTPFVFLYMNIGGRTEEKRSRMHKVIQKVAAFSMKLVPGVKYTACNPFGEDFSTPSVIVCNHQSHLDLIPVLAMHDKMVILTTDWVWNDPFYGYIIRQAEFLPASAGIDNILPQLDDLVKRGYSIMIFPEGTRSLDCRVGRFHKGAFHIADKLGLDVVPVVLYGTGKALPKHSRLLRTWPVRLEIDRRIPVDGLRAMGTSREQASNMRKYYIERYARLADSMERDV